MLVGTYFHGAAQQFLAIGGSAAFGADMRWLVYQQYIFFWVTLKRLFEFAQ
jgi:hypothetical protein